MIQEFMSLFERYVVATEKLVIETREANALQRDILSVRQSLVATAAENVVDIRESAAPQTEEKTATEPVKKSSGKISKPKSTPAADPEPEPEEEEEEEEADPDDPPAATLEDITAAVEEYYEKDGSLGRKERKASFTALRTKYSVSSIKELPENKLSAFLRDVKALPVK